MSRWTIEEEKDEVDGSTIYHILDDGIVLENVFDKDEALKIVDGYENCQHEVLEPPYWGSGNPRPIVIACTHCGRETEISLDFHSLEFT